MTDAAGLVLAGGASKRFGRDKIREDLRGEPLVAHAVRRLSEVVPETYVVSTRGDPLPSLPDDLSVGFIRDVEPFDGPLRATARGLAFVDSIWSVVVGGDMPDLQPTVLRALLTHASERSALATALGEADRFRPLPCVVRTGPARERAHELLERGDRSLRSLLARLGVAILDEPAWTALDPDRRTLIDVDVPADLERLRR